MRRPRRPHTRHTYLSDGAKGAHEEFKGVAAGRGRRSASASTGGLNGNRNVFESAAHSINCYRSTGTFIRSQSCPEEVLSTHVLTGNSVISDLTTKVARVLGR